MKTIENSFKAGLRGWRRQIGLWLGLANAYSAEICAGAGFDWLLIDGEHAPNDLVSILAQLQAVAPYASHPVVRPPSDDPVFIKRLLDIGVLTFLVPMIETAEQAERLVRATRYPPEGARGVGSALARAAQWGRTDGYLRRANVDIAVIAQIESVAALQNLEAIAAVDGIDAVFIGTSDLAADMGFPGEVDRAEVKAEVAAALKRAHRANKPCGFLASGQGAERYLAMGCDFVAVGMDVGLLSKAVHDLAAKFMPLVDEPGS